MKKIFTLLAVLMTSLTAMAQITFYGTWKNNSNSFPSFDNYVEVTINDNGTSKIVMKDIVFGNDVLGTITLNNVTTEQNGTGYSFIMGSQTKFDITNGNMSDVKEGVFEGWGSIDGDNLQLTANYFDYGSTSLRYVKFNGTKVQTKPDGPTITDTETFSSDLSTSTAAGDTKTTKNATAILSKYSDNTYSLTLKPVETADASYGAITFSGLGFEEENGETYISGYVDATTEETSPLYGKNIKGDLSAVINVDGDLVVYAMLVDMDDENFNVEMQFGKEEVEPFEPVSMAGTLSSFSRTDDGDVSDQKPSLLTITDEGEGKCTLTMTEGTLPGTTLSLGTITIPSVSYEADEATATMTLSSGKVEATTECAHPFYQTITVNSLSGSIAVKTDENTKDEAMLANANITFTVDNDGTETVNYTFTTNGYVTGVDTVKKADGTVQRIYTISGIATTQMQRGINIVRHADGTVTKVVKR